MKNFRKILALVLAVVMTVSTFTVAFAAEEKTSGEKLKALGLIAGNEAGDLMENGTITRAEAAQIVVKVMNWDVEPATAYTFADATWAKAQAATLVKKGITAGVGNNKFGGTVKMDALQVYAWIYAALTGDTASAWANPSLLSAILSADQVAAVIATKGTPAKRSDIFTGMVTILTTEIAGTTQLDKLIEAGVVTEEAAVAAGLKEAPVTENVITSVELINYKEAKVTFSKEASDDKAAYKFAGVAVTNVTLSADKKEATVVLATALTAQAKVTFNYEKDTYKFEKKDLSIIDATLPVVVDVKTTDKGKLTVTFSEAIDPASVISVKVDNGMLYASVSAVSADFRTVVATVSSATDGKEYKLEISGAKDFAGYTMAPKTIEAYKYEAVKAPITVTVKEADSKKVVLSLSAATVKALNVANFTYILNQVPTSATLSADKKEVTLDFTGYNAPEGTWTLTIKKADEMFEDSWGNKSAADITLSFTVVIDKTAPTVGIKEVKQADGKLVVVYNEAVVTTGASTYANYEIQGADGKVISNAFVTGTAITNKDAKEFTLAINKDAFASENCTLVVKKDVIADASGNKVAETKITFATKYMRLLDATVKAVKAADATKTSKIYVTYTNSMLATTTDAAKWAVSAGEIKSVSFDEGSTKVVVITLKEDTAIAGLVVTTTAINDVDGNSLKGAKLSVTFAALTASDVIASTTTMTAAALDAQTVELVVTGRVTEGIATTAFLVDFVGDTATKTATAAAVKNVEVKDINDVTCTVITIALPELYKVNAEALNTSKQVRIEATGLVLSSGVKLEAMVKTVADKIAPTVTGDLKATVASKTATVAFTETVLDAKGLLATELVVKYDGKVLVAGNDYTVAVGANLTITLTIDKVEKDKEVTVSLVKSSNYAKDAAGNALAAFEKTIKVVD
jgi:hypothetical protein